MKMWILAMTMTVAVAANAQDKKHYREHFTTEQRAQLKAKRMTLALDLKNSKKMCSNYLLKMVKRMPNLLNSIKLKDKTAKSLLMMKNLP